MPNTQIVLLNGVGSAGKSSIAKALQAIASKPYLHVQMDAFLDMLPEAYQAHPESFTYKTVNENGRPVVVIKPGPVGERLMQGMRHAIAAMAERGNNLIVDDVLMGSAAAEYAKELAHSSVYWVGVFAPLDILEDRERRRGDRLIGLARWQFERVHREMSYDLEVDTSSALPMECAELIKRRFRL